LKNNQNKSLIVYVIASCSMTWICWITALSLGYKDISFTRLITWDFESSKQMVLFFFFRVGVYGPLIASLLVTVHFYKSAGLKDLWQGIIKWKVEIRWYLYALLIPVGLNLIVVLIGVVAGISFGDFFKSDIPMTFILIYFLYQLLTSGMEEPGWRGFALEKLQSNFTAEKASWILGLIWAVWHYPLLISLYLSQGIVSIIFSLAGFNMVMIGQTIIYTWLYNNTESVLITILHHALGNTATAFILGTVATHNPAIGVITALVTWGLAWLLLKIYGGKTLTA